MTSFEEALHSLLGHPPVRRRFVTLRRRLMALTVIVALVAALVTLIFSGDGSHTHSRSLHAAAPGAPGLRAHLGRVASAQDHAITRVAARTPYVAKGGRRHKEIALTFDDGPGPYTFRVLHQLRRLHVQATFFEVGQMLPVFSDAARAVRKRYPVGDHTLSHPPMAALGAEAQRTQILDDASRLRIYGNPFPRLFRPPYRSFNSITLALMRRYRMLMVLWTIDSRDYTRPGTAQIVRNVLSAAKPGAIVLMHDAGGPRDETVAALPAIVHKLRKRGFHFVTVPRMLVDAPPPKAQKLPPPYGVAR
jgi:peptidoglycan/xylan/chitin deacetylase (PgdA/CDA1 family)